MTDIFEHLRVPRQWRRWVLAAALVGLGVWLGFFDSHSIARRIRWHRDAAAVEVENRHLEQQIAELERRLKDVRSEEVVEQVAREQYQMRRPGETVYRVEKAE